MNHHNAPPRASQFDHAGPFIDNLQYSNWSDEIFNQIKRSPLHAIHVTIVYHELFREMVANIIAWNHHFERHADIIL